MMPVSTQAAHATTRPFPHRGFVTALFCAVLLMWTAGNACAQKKGISAQLTVGLPTGDFGKLVKTGYGAQGSYLYELSPNLVVGGGLGFKYFSHKTLDAGFFTVPLMGVFRWHIPMGDTRLYLGTEFGLHLVTVNEAVTSTRTRTIRETDFGASPMVGALIPLGGTRLDLTVRYDFIGTSGPDATWIGLNAGILFGL
jgi:hypothetical protein